jgi:hypothetical protein
VSGGFRGRGSLRSVWPPPALGRLSLVRCRVGHGMASLEDGERHSPLRSISIFSIAWRIEG